MASLTRWPFLLAPLGPLKINFQAPGQVTRQSGHRTLLPFAQISIFRQNTDLAMRTICGLQRAVEMYTIVCRSGQQPKTSGNALILNKNDVLTNFVITAINRVITKVV